MDLDPVRRIVTQDAGLAGVAVVRADGTPHTSLVNAGVLDHPSSGTPVVGYVTYGQVKLRNLRARPATSILWRAGGGGRPSPPPIPQTSQPAGHLAARRRAARTPHGLRGMPRPAVRRA
jgi:hypothetical protein